MGAYCPKWKRLLRRVCPFLFKKCWGQNYHWFWHELCYCRIGINGVTEPDIIKNKPVEGYLKGG